MLCDYNRFFLLFASLRTNLTATTTITTTTTTPQPYRPPPPPDNYQTYHEALKDMPWKGIVHSNATVANLIRKAEIRVLPAVIVVDDQVTFLFFPNERRNFKAFF